MSRTPNVPPDMTVINWQVTTTEDLSLLSDKEFEQLWGDLGRSIRTLAMKRAARQSSEEGPK